MSVSHIVRLLFAIALSGAIGWLSLLVFNAVKVMQQLEAFEASVPQSGLGTLARALEEAVTNMRGGSSLFLAVGIAGVLLSEIFRTRSLLYYAGATGALAAVLATAVWPHGNTAGNAHAAAALGMAGFVAGGIYWIVAGQPARRG